MAVILALTLLFTLFACGKRGDSNTSPSGDSSPAGNTGAASGLEEQGIDTDHCAVNYLIGSNAEVQWAAGQDTPIKYVLDVPMIVYSEPLFFTLYAFVNGDATPENIYPSWRNPDPYFGQEYGMLMLATIWKDRENYNDILAWANAYTGVDYYDVGETSRPITADSYSLYTAPPSNYVSVAG